MNRILALSFLVIGFICASQAAVQAQTNAGQTDQPNPPNVVVLFIDDMGYADPSCFGNPHVKTPHIDQMAADGIKLTNFYVNSPICSASRVAVTTGHYPGRWKIHSFLQMRNANEARGMNHFLKPEAPTA